MAVQSWNRLQRSGVRIRQEWRDSALPNRRHTQRSILTTAAGVPLAGPTTLLSQYRHETDTRLELLVRWYESTSGSALDSVSIDLDRTTGWERIERSLSTPEEANYVRFYFRLYPPDEGEKRVASFDNIQLVEWTESATSGGKTTTTSVYTSPRHRVHLEYPI
jgi:hypothetical protein